MKLEQLNKTTLVACLQELANDCGEDVWGVVRRVGKLEGKNIETFQSRWRANELAFNLYKLRHGDLFWQSGYVHTKPDWQLDDNLPAQRDSDAKGASYIEIRLPALEALGFEHESFIITKIVTMDRMNEMEDRKIHAMTDHLNKKRWRNVYEWNASKLAVVRDSSVSKDCAEGFIELWSKVVIDI